MARGFPIAMLLTAASIVAAQQPGIELQVPTRALELGEAVDVQLICTNTEMPEPPEAIVPEGLDLVLTNKAPATVSSTTIINGRRTDRVTYTYRMQLTAQKEGTYTLGPISVVADGTTYEADPITIVVRASDDASTAKGDRYLFVEMDAWPRSLYVTQTMTATLEIGIRKVRIGGRSINMNLFRDVLDQRASAFSVFARGKATLRDTALPDSAGQRHRYAVYRVVMEIRAEQVGPMRIGPVFLKANYPLSVRRGFFGRYDVTRARKETARAEAITIDVKGPPDEGRPTDFAGAIGAYKMRVTAKPTRVAQGEPVTLTVSIAGVPLEGIAGPGLAEQPELTSRFDYSKDELVGDLERGFKVFRRAVFPKQQGEQTIPPLSWSYFDPQRERYVTLTSGAIPITVDPPAPGAQVLTPPGATDPASSATTLTLLAGGVSPNYVDPDLVLVSQAFVLTGPWIALLIAPPLLCLGVTLTARRRARLRADAGFARRGRAARNARARIAQAMRDGDPVRQLQGLFEALIGYLADRFDLPPGALTPGEVRSLLVSNGAGERLISDVVAFLEECDTARYAGAGDEARSTDAPRATGASMVSASAPAGVRRWIKQIEKTTR